MTPDVVACCPAPFYDPFATLAWLREGADYSIRGEFNADDPTRQTPAEEIRALSRRHHLHA